MRQFITFLLIVLYPGVLNMDIGFYPQKSGVELTLTNIRKSDGLIRIGVFRSEVGYPDKPLYKFSLAKDSINNGTIRFLIPVDGPGPVSLCILDDDNKNENMDYIFGILPKEGFGFSNNPKISLRGAPSFSTTSFIYEEGIKDISIRMIYMR
jgi:uncharacterized protein (DUF2141 family)